MNLSINKITYVIRGCLFLNGVGSCFSAVFQKTSTLNEDRFFTIFFHRQIAEEIRNVSMTDISTLPQLCCYTTWWNLKKFRTTAKLGFETRLFEFFKFHKVVQQRRPSEEMYVSFWTVV